MLVDKKILGGGIAMIVVGMAISAMLTDMAPVGREGMTDEQIAEFLLEERENEEKRQQRNDAKQKKKRQS